MAPQPVKIGLLPAMVEQAWTEAIYRQANAQARKAATNNPASARTEFLWHVRGALCEIAVAWYLDLEWTGKIGNTTDGSRHDVGDRYEVRSAAAGPLRLYPKDARHPANTPIILCHLADPLAERPGPVHLVGWLLIGDGLYTAPLPVRGYHETGHLNTGHTTLVEIERLYDVRQLPSGV